MKKKLMISAGLFVSALIFLAGCRTQETKKDKDGKETLLIAAAASMEYSLEEELIPLFEEKHEGISVEGAYDSSGRLKTQIEEGLAADIFLSAAKGQMDELKQAGRIEESSCMDLLQNEIVLITPTDNPAGLETFEDIVRSESIAVGDPLSVPAGQYAKEALTALSLWDEVEKRASFGSNVTEVLNWVAEGSAQAGVVYATDAAITPDVTVIAKAPEGSLSEPVIYPAGVLQSSAHKDAAVQFLKFLKSEEAAGIFVKYGFTPVR